MTIVHDYPMRSVPTVNRLIEALPRRERARLLNGCVTVDFVAGEVLCSTGQPVEFAWFPLSGLIFRGARVADHPTVQIGMTGNEGMLGEILMIGGGTSPWRAECQSDGTALRIPAADFLELVGECPALEETAFQYLYSMISMASRTTPCTRFHGVEARLARWLLMTDDRTRADHFNLTHQFLAEMLGVQRSAVTLAAGALQALGVIHYSRGRISILSRPGLEDISCACYRDSERTHIGQYAEGA